ncbi:amidohydrolase family protein, partial [Mycobacterium palustre]|uniref:amidohydrolase family protein n=1 Tax=Mycobacterium palustre TaxID=153971 RepID=UPI0021F3725D
EARAAALDAAAAAGIVAVHECAGPQIGGLDDWLRLRDLDHGVEVIGYWGQAITTAAEARALKHETGARGLAGDLFVDGALGSRTAWLHEPYTDAPDRGGACYLGPDAVEAHVRACTEAEIAAGFHVIGDAAVSAAVDAFERVVADVGVTAVARCGHRLEHVEMVTAEQAAKLGAWGVIASVQPAFDALWGGVDGMYARRLGAERAGRLNPLALLASQGVPLALGSDAPVTCLDPWLGVRAAVNHHTPGSAISARAAFAAATRGGWRSAISARAAFAAATRGGW